MWDTLFDVSDGVPKTAQAELKVDERKPLHTRPRFGLTSALFVEYDDWCQ